LSTIGRNSVRRARAVSKERSDQHFKVRLRCRPTVAQFWWRLLKGPRRPSASGAARICRLLADAAAPVRVHSYRCPNVGWRRVLCWSAPSGR